MTLLTSFKKTKNSFSQVLKELGWIDTGIFISNKLLRLVSQDKLRIYKYYLVIQPVRDKPYLPPHRGKEIKIRLIDKTDTVISSFPRPLHVIESRFNCGAKCLVAFKDDRFIGFLWLQLGPYQEDEVRARFIPLPENRAAWDFDVFIVPEYRFGLAFTRLWDEANNLLSNSDIYWSYSRITATNSVSLKSHLRQNAECLGSAHFLCSDKWQLTVASLFPYFHLSFHENSYPKFYLKTKLMTSQSIS